MSGLTLRDVRMVFPGGHVALQELNLHVAPEEFMVLVGPSGCGKSTTLRIIAGLEEPTRGTVLIGDRIVNHEPPKDRDIAMVFQGFALFPHMSVQDNLAFGLKMRRRALGLGRRDILARVRETARILAIEHLLKRRPRALSGGERQRVAVGRAIIRRPKAFLFDEPLSNVDAQARVEMRAEVKRLQRELKTTTVYVTHDQEEAMSLGDRIAVMKSGRIEQVGRPRDVYALPVNRFVAGFVGTPPMSFLDGRIESADGRPLFVDGQTRIALPAAWMAALAPQAGRPAVLGIRPEAVQAASSAASHGALVPARIDRVEHLGACQVARLTIPSGKTIVGRFSADATLVECERVQLVVDLAGVHVFAADEAGARLTPASAGDDA